MHMAWGVKRLLAIAPLLAACGDDGQGAATATEGTGDGSTGTHASTGSRTTEASGSSGDATGGSTGDNPCSPADADGDGHEAIVCGGDDCDDTDPLSHPGIEHDGWEQLVLFPNPGGGGWQYHAWLTGTDGLADVFWAFNGSIFQMDEESANVWGCCTQLGTGNEPRVALGVDGTYRLVHVGFASDPAVRGIYYTQVGSNAEQTIEELPSGAPNPFGLDIAVDPTTGTMHVVYGVLYEFPPTMRYATSGDGQTWTTETIAENAAGFGGTVVLDRDGVPHVSFASNDNEVMHGVREGGGWTVEVVASGYEVGATSMARDDEGDLHVAFSVTGLEDADDGLHYVRQQAGVWSDPSEIDGDTVWFDDVGTWDYRPALAVGPGDQPHVAYHDHGAGVLRYATLVDGQWQARVIDDAQGDYTPQAGWYPQLDLHDGQLAISEATEATNEYRRYTFAIDDGRDNDCDGMIDEGP